MPGSMQCTTRGRVDDEFSVYAYSLKLGIRFPPHSFFVEMLDDYNIGVNQMTLNSWASVFGLISKCDLKGISPSFPAFIRLVTLAKSLGAAEGWFALSYKGQYRTVVGSRQSGIIGTKGGLSCTHLIAKYASI